MDVIVVGASPAGATATKHIVEAGLNTLIIEKGILPRDKTCVGMYLVKHWKALTITYQNI